MGARYKNNPKVAKNYCATLRVIFMKSFRINKKQLIIGISFLLAGTMEYLVSRPIGSTYFLYKFKSIQLFFHHMPNLYGKMGIFAPEFFHPLALSLISMALVSSRKSRMAICIAWFTVDSMFELGQKYGTLLMEYLPKWFGTVPILENLKSYFVNGRFDICDLIAIGLGSFTAFFIGELISKKGGSNENQHSEQEGFDSRTLGYN